MNAAAYSVAVADVTTVLMITLGKQTGALGASLSAQSPKNRMPPALDRASGIREESYATFPANSSERR